MYSMLYYENSLPFNKAKTILTYPSNQILINNDVLLLLFTRVHLPKLHYGSSRKL